MSKRTLIVGVALAAMNLAGMTAVAQAHTSDDPASKRHRALGQREVLATADHTVASQEQPTDALEQFRRGGRASLEQPTSDSVQRAGLAQERYYSTWGYGDPTVEQGLAQERYYSTWRYGDTPAPAPAEPSGQPGWLVPVLGVLAAGLALLGVLAAMLVRRTRGRVRVRQAA